MATAVRTVATKGKSGSSRVKSVARDARANRASLMLLFIPAAFLMVLGLAMALSAGSSSAVKGYGTSLWYFQRQSLYGLGGLIILVVAMRVPYRVWGRVAALTVVTAVALMMLTLHEAAGATYYGASRWIDLGPLTIQPSEFAKVGMIFWSAMWAAKVWERKSKSKTDRGPWLEARQLFPIGAALLVVDILLLLQRDLGTAIIVSGTTLLIMFVAGLRRSHLIWISLIGMAGVTVLTVAEPYRRQRFMDSYINPWADPKGAGWQLVQGLIAIGSGGLFGVGLGQSKANSYVPFAHSDFVFAIVAEELGLLGASVVLIAFGVMLYAGVRIAMAAPDTHGRLLAAGVTAWIGLQATINIGAVTGLLPITGVPVPFISFGGSALVAMLFAIGVLASVAISGVTKQGPKGSGTVVKMARGHLSLVHSTTSQAKGKRPARAKSGGRRRASRDRGRV